MKKIIQSSLILFLMSNNSLDAKLFKKTKTKKCIEYYRIDIEHSNLFYSKSTTFQEARNAKECALVAFDLNGVVFNKNMSLVPQFINEVRKKRGFLYTMNLAMAGKKLNGERTFINSEGKKEKTCFDAILTRHDCPNDPFQEYIADLRMAVTTINKLNIPMVKLLYELHHAGHHNYIISNIGKNVLSEMVKKIANNKFFNLLSHDQHSYLINFLKNKDHSFVSGPENDWITKPNSKTYTIFLEKNNKRKKNRIFIDDKKENVIAAIENGFDFGIVYKDLKNLEDILFNVLHLKR